MARVLVTGINGFVGTVLAGRLEDAGYEVFGIDLAGDDRRIFPVDLGDLPALRECVRMVAPDYVLHLAAISRVDFENPTQLYQVNVNGTMNLLIAAVNAAHLPRFLFVSSAQVYGRATESDEPISELAPVAPVNHYGASKAAAENMVMAFNREYDLPVMIARPFNHTGRGQLPYFVIPKIVNAFRGRQPSITLGSIDVMRDISDVRDVVDAYVLMMERFTDRGIFNIAGGVGIMISDVLKVLERLTGHHIEVHKGEALVRKNDIRHSIGDARKIRELAGWAPRHQLADTLRWMLEAEDR